MADQVLLKIVCLLMRWLFSLAILVVRGDRAKNAGLLALRHENAVLRRNAGRVRYDPADRAWFAALTRFIPRRRWAEIFPKIWRAMIAPRMRLPMPATWWLLSRRSMGKESIWTIEGSALGVHRFVTTAPGRDPVAETQRTAGIVLSYMTKMGVSSSVVEAMSETRDVRWLSAREASAMNLITNRTTDSVAKP